MHFVPLQNWLVVCLSPHHSHHLRSHHLSLPRPFTPDLKLISFTNPFLHSLPGSLRTAFTAWSWTCSELTGHWRLFVLFFFLYFFVSGYVCWSHSAFESTLNSSIISYHVLWCRDQWSGSEPSYQLRFTDGYEPERIYWDDDELQLTSNTLQHKPTRSVQQYPVR